MSDFITGPKGQAALGLPAGSTIQLFYTNHFDAAGNPLPFSTPNGLVAPGQDIHVAKPLSAFQDQLSLNKAFGLANVTAGAYFANYTQTNNWYFTQVLTDVADNPKFLDAIVTTPGGTPTQITQNGFLNQMSGYTNGTGQTTVFSGVLGGNMQLTDKLRADLGGRVEYDNYVQSSENTSTFDLDGDSTTTCNNETFGNGSFRHFSRGITDWAASLGLNYAVTDNISVYASAARGYKMPALDEFLQRDGAAAGGSVRVAHGEVDRGRSEGNRRPVRLYRERILHEAHRTSSPRVSSSTRSRADRFGRFNSHPRTTRTEWSWSFSPTRFRGWSCGATAPSCGPSSERALARTSGV